MSAPQLSKIVATHCDCWKSISHDDASVTTNSYFHRHLRKLDAQLNSKTEIGLNNAHNKYAESAYYANQILH
jgi:hypothetical protein